MREPVSAELVRHALPAGHRWDRVSGVTPVGDAAHLMSPFAGEGADLAMLDGAEPARCPAARPDDVETALTAYEERMSPRSEAAAQWARGATPLFGEDAPRGLLEMFAGHE